MLRRAMILTRNVGYSRQIPALSQHKRVLANSFQTRYCLFANAASSPHSEDSPGGHAAESVMNMSANKAMRFVYMRTLPLVKQEELEGEVDLIASRIEQAARAVIEKHASGISDDRSAVHLHTSALAIGSHRVLSSKIRNEIRVNNMIRAGFGAFPMSENETEPDPSAEKKRPDFWVVRMALWFSFDRMRAIRRMTENMVRDFGASFATSRGDTMENEQATHRLTVNKCLYNEICRKEGLPHLTKIFCALDKAIYSPITPESHGIEFQLRKTLADPDSTHCDFSFTKIR